MLQKFYIDNVILFTLISLLISTMLSWISIKIASNIGLMDIPGSADHKNHKKPIPLTGGLVLISIIIIMVYYTELWKSPKIFGVLVSGIFIQFLV